jgi:hypothetical protein
MGNATQFEDRNQLIERVRDHVQRKIDLKEWNLTTRNRLHLCRARDTGMPAGWNGGADVGGTDVSYYHINVRNLHWREAATNCYAYLDKVIDLSTGREIEHYTCELKWEGTMQSAVRIQPGKLQRPRCIHRNPFSSETTLAQASN